ncbi:MAG: hypothetical protein CMJ59_02105 [Planctomycetaceae bacterium]|nr:hypothetical protein [Planctomycetaceae bacterium]
MALAVSCSHVFVIDTFDDVQAQRMTAIAQLIDSGNQMRRSFDFAIAGRVADDDFWIRGLTVFWVIGPAAQINGLLNDKGFRNDFCQFGNRDKEGARITSPDGKLLQLSGGRPGKLSCRRTPQCLRHDNFADPGSTTNVRTSEMDEDLFSQAFQER